MTTVYNYIKRTHEVVDSNGNVVGATDRTHFGGVALADFCCRNSVSPQRVKYRMLTYRHDFRQVGIEFKTV